MTDYLDRAKRLLSRLPATGSRADTSALLDEIERLEAKNSRHLAALDEKLAALQPTTRELLWWRTLPWLTWTIALVAVYCGMAAIVESELCSRTRGGLLTCRIGPAAELEGAAIVFVGLILFVIPFRASRPRTIVIWALVTLIVFAAFGPLLVRIV